MATIQFDRDGFRVVRTPGMVHGIVVRSAPMSAAIAGFETILGGNVTWLTQLCEKAPGAASNLTLRHAAERGGNAVVGAYDATEIMPAVTEVLADATAVLVEPVSPS